MNHSQWIFIHFLLLWWKQHSQSALDKQDLEQRHPLDLSFSWLWVFRLISALQTNARFHGRSISWSVFSKFTSASGNHHQFITISLGDMPMASHAITSSYLQLFGSQIHFLLFLELHCLVTSGSLSLPLYKLLYFNLYSILNFYPQLLQI